MSTNPTHFSSIAPVFLGRTVPEPGWVCGYAAIIDTLQLPVPPPARIVLVSERNKRMETEHWLVLPSSYLPEDHSELSQIQALYHHLVFALKYEGVNLLVFKKLTEHYPVETLAELVSIESTGQYSRRIWFLLEWLLGQQLPGIEDLSRKNYVPVLDTNIQYGANGEKSPRHKVLNNLPGTPDYCPLTFKTPFLEESIARYNQPEKRLTAIGSFKKDVLTRASAFLMLKDSRASFTIEGEQPQDKRLTRWAQAIGQAGSRVLNKTELQRLQEMVLESGRFIEMGYRTRGGFIGERDRITLAPLPDHISARWQDLDRLMAGLLKTHEKLLEEPFDAVLAAALIAFGFVFIHPFEDGNGRIHRYLIHHVLAEKKYSEPGMIFPVSSAMLHHIGRYKKVLESYSAPLLVYIDWQETPDHNVEVINDTIDYYRYFDGTKQAEFLYDCVIETIERIIPEEAAYIQHYDTFKTWLDQQYEMPDKLCSLLAGFLHQNDGKLSKRAQNKELSSLTAEEVSLIEKQYREIFEL